MQQLTPTVICKSRVLAETCSALNRKTFHQEIPLDTAWEESHGNPGSLAFDFACIALSPEKVVTDEVTRSEKYAPFIKKRKKFILSIECDAAKSSFPRVARRVGAGKVTWGEKCVDIV